MRTFHVFLVNKNIMNLTKDDSYLLFHTFMKIKKLSKDDLSLGINLYEQVADPIDKDIFNKELFKYYDECDFYSRFKSRHSYINKYRDENSVLNVRSAFLKIESNVSCPDFFKYLKKKHNLFVCDFDNVDYFWSDKI